MARDVDGKGVYPTDDRAVSFCLIGAETALRLSVETRLAIRAVTNHMSEKPLVRLNDMYGHEWVLETIRKAIDREEKMNKG